MSNLKERFILAGAALPVLVGAVLLLPYLQYVVVALASAIFSGLGALEISRMFGRRGISVNKVQAVLLGMVLPTAAWLDATDFFSIQVFLPALIVSAGLIIARQAFIFTEQRLKGTLEKTAASFLLLVYPGLFISYMIRITTLPLPGLSVLMFFALIFANDSLAYGVGMLFGGGNRNIFAASPNKSLAGLIGGIAGSVGAAYLFYVIRPELFTGSPFLPIPVAVLCACAADIGDLAESAMKRSAAVKDSGNILKGRGGVMDSIDSILYGAPVFYYAISILLSRGSGS